MHTAFERYIGLSHLRNAAERWTPYDSHMRRSKTRNLFIFYIHGGWISLNKKGHVHILFERNFKVTWSCDNIVDIILQKI